MFEAFLTLLDDDLAEETVWEIFAVCLEEVLEPLDVSFPAVWQPRVEDSVGLSELRTWLDDREVFADVEVEDLWTIFIWLSEAEEVLADCELAELDLLCEVSDFEV